MWKIVLCLRWWRYLCHLISCVLTTIYYTSKKWTLNQNDGKNDELKSNVKSWYLRNYYMSEETGQKRLLTKLFKWLKMVSGIKKKKRVRLLKMNCGFKWSFWRMVSNAKLNYCITSHLFLTSFPDYSVRKFVDGKMEGKRITSVIKNISYLLLVLVFANWLCSGPWLTTLLTCV